MWQLPTMWSSPSLPLKSTGKPSLLATPSFLSWLLRSLVLPLDPLSGIQPLSLHVNLEFPPSLQRRWRLSLTLSSTGHRVYKRRQNRFAKNTQSFAENLCWSMMVATLQNWEVSVAWWRDSQHNTFLMVMLVWINLLLYKDFSSLIDLYCPSMCSICNYAQ